MASPVCQSGRKRRRKKIKVAIIISPTRRRGQSGVAPVRHCPGSISGPCRHAGPPTTPAQSVRHCRRRASSKVLPTASKRVLVPCTDRREVAFRGSSAVVFRRDLAPIQHGAVRARGSLKFVSSQAPVPAGACSFRSGPGSGAGVVPPPQARHQQRRRIRHFDMPVSFHTRVSVCK